MEIMIFLHVTPKKKRKKKKRRRKKNMECGRIEKRVEMDKLVGAF